MLETWEVTPNNGEPFRIKGNKVPKDKTDPRRSSSYVHYFETKDGDILRYSASHYEVKEINEL